MKSTSFTLTILFFLIHMSSLQAQDWANLNHFQNKNTALKTQPSTKDRIVFMGNSITEGWSYHHPEYFANKEYINRGISGQTTPQMVLRFRQDVIELKPAAVIILAGINDIAENTGPISIEMIAGNIISMAELAKANNIKVVLCSVLPAFEFSWRKDLKPANKVVQLNTLLSTYAKEHDIVYVDYFSAMANTENGLKKELGSDGVHPNKTGYQIMEPLLEAGIKQALNVH